MSDWKVWVAIALTGLCVWRSEARLLRLIAVVFHLVVLAQYGIFLSNVGRNTFEHVTRVETSPDTFREGVFAEAKAADGFARNQLSAIYIVGICLSLLAIYPFVFRPSRPQSPPKN